MNKSNFLLVATLTSVLVLIVIYGNHKFDNSWEKFDEPTIIIKNDNEKDETIKKEKEKLKYPLLVLTYDDGFETDYSIVYPLLEERGIVGTSFVNGGHANNQNGKIRRMSWEQIKELKSNGWDIQGHTFTHPRLSELTDEEIHAQFKMNDETFKENGLDIPEHTAYPYGDYDENVREIGEEYRKTLRRINPSGDIPYNTWDNFDFYNISARGTDIQDGNISRLQERKNDIDLAMENDGILIFFSHEFKQSGAEQYETQVEYYEELIDYAIEKGIKFVTMSEMYELVTDYQKQ